MTFPATPGDRFLVMALGAICGIPLGFLLISVCDRIAVWWKSR